jgi:short-chain fatty acids transporter
VFNEVTSVQEFDMKSNTRGLERFAFSVTTWAEKWFPDSYIFAVLAVVVVSLGALAAGVAPKAIATTFGEGYWSLIPFTMQMAIVVISGYVVASSPPAGKLIRWLATFPKTERGAVAYIALFTILASLLNWAFSLVFGGLYVRALARRTDIRMDYRAAGAAGYLGLGATWALGLSSSAAQLQANVESIPKSLLPITGVIPFRETIFLPQSMAMLAVLTIVSVVIAYLSAPTRERAVTASDLGIDVMEDMKDGVSKPEKPSEWLEYSPALTLFVAILGLGWLCTEFAGKDPLVAISNLNTYNLLFLIAGMILTWRPKRFLALVSKAVPSVAGILIQFPLYGSIAYLLTKAATADGQTLSHHISGFFVSISTRDTYSALMGVYSAVLGFFIPSGGGKWIIEAPYLMQAANELKVHLGWTVMVYNAAEALPNLINPFFMVALVGVLGLKARDIIGYTVTQLVVHAPLVILMLWALGETLAYHPPVMP